MRTGMAWLLAGMVILTASTKTWAEEGEAKESKGSAGSASTQLVSEGEFAKWLVQVLGISRFLPPNPSELECFNVLLQNEIAPRDGWNSTNVVTRATLARVIIQSLSRQDEVKDPDSDASWIEYLKEVGIDISTIGAAVENLDILDSTLANEAVVISSDPLNKIHKIRVTDDQQLGADLSGITRIFVQAEETPPPPTPRPPAPAPRPTPRPPPLTPN